MSLFEKFYSHQLLLLKDSPWRITGKSIYFFPETFAVRALEPYLFFQSASLCLILHPELNQYSVRRFVRESVRLLYDERISTFSVFNPPILNNRRCWSVLSSLGPASGQKMPLQFELKHSERQERWGRREEEGQRERDRKTCLQGCILIHSFALFSSAVFCLDDCGTLHIFTMEAHGEGVTSSTSVWILPHQMGTGRSGLWRAKWETKRPSFIKLTQDPTQIWEQKSSEEGARGIYDTSQPQIEQ